MSLKLLKQSVDIVQEELQGSKQNKTSGKRSGSYNIKAEDKKFKPYKKNIQEVKSDLKTKDKKSEENIKRLLALSMNTINIKDAEKRAHKGRYVKKIIPKVKQESIFTEEDFRKFEEEYFNS